MARGTHSQRASFFGVCLSCGAILSGWLASSIPILWLSIPIYVLAAIAAVAGFVITFRGH
jgi:hypothetical protein